MNKIDILFSKFFNCHHVPGCPLHGRESKIKNCDECEAEWIKNKKHELKDAIENGGLSLLVSKK